MSTMDRQELIDRYAAGPGELKAAFALAPVESLTWKPSDSDWSIHEIIIHCADAETYAGIRIRQLAAEAAPTILAWDQEQWARELRYHDQPLEPAFALITAIRQSTLALIRTFDEDAWSHVGKHTEAGDYTADDWLATYGDHLHIHAVQIRDNIDRWRSASSAAG